MLELEKMRYFWEKELYKIYYFSSKWELPESFRPQSHIHSYLWYFTPGKPPVIMCMYRAFSHQSGGRQKRRQFCCLSYWLWKKKKITKSKQLLTGLIMWISLLKDPDHLYWCKILPEHTLSWKKTTTKLLFSNWKLLVILSVKEHL